jgi:hypothetical protein
MMPASTNGGGTCLAFPDVCKTPAPPAPFVPVPYPNSASCSQAKGSTCPDKVKFLNKKPIVKTSEISMSSGDEAGTAGGGMISSKIKGPAKYQLGSNKVEAQGKGVAYIGCMVAQNGTANANMPAGAQIAPSQTEIKVMP